MIELLFQSGRKTGTPSGTPGDWPHPNHSTLTPQLVYQICYRSISSLSTRVSGQPLTIGQDPTGFYGVSGTFDLDDVGIWRRALDGFEVQSIYGAAQTSGQSFDVYGPVVLHMERSGSDLIIAWQEGTLFQADTPGEPWTTDV